MTALSDPATTAAVALADLRDSLDRLRIQRDEFRERTLRAEAERDTWRATASTKVMSP